jgi:hypothetical protein
LYYVVVPMKKTLYHVVPMKKTSFLCFLYP